MKTLKLKEKSRNNQGVSLQITHIPVANCTRVMLRHRTLALRLDMKGLIWIFISLNKNIRNE